MNGHRASLLAFAIAIASAIGLTGCTTPSGASPAPTAAIGPVGTAVPTGAASEAALATRTSDGGEVTAVVSWAGPAKGAVFDVTLDTHSVDLDALDLTDAILRNDRGERLNPEPWTAPRGGHHRQGALRFSDRAGSFLARARWIELVLVGVGGIPERTFRWEVAA